MANTVIVRKLLDGPRIAIFSVYLKSDGASGELVNYTIIDPNVDLIPSMGVGQRLALEKLWFGSAGVDILFKFDNNADPVIDFPIWVLPASTTDGELDLTSFGGLPDKSGINASGKLMISTTGFTTTADQASFVIQVLKRPSPYVNP